MAAVTGQPGLAIIGVLRKIVSHSSLDFRIKLPGKRGTEKCFVEDRI